ncbi:MAG TPA: penicillin-binding transpeptidase domain-containing protein [Jatrophihabitans sp.]|nr:penicillin-binding transpeptidase domain-containing protein [Jatrophihabitans sp.]
MLLYPILTIDPAHPPYPPGRRPGRLSRVLGALVLAGGVVTACTHSTPSPQTVAAQRFLDAVGRGDAATASRLTSSPDVAAPALRASFTGLGSRAKGTLHVTSVHTEGKASTAQFAASWTFPGVSTPWRYDGRLPLRRTGKTWQVTWAAADLHPDLAAGLHLQVRRVQPARAALNTSDGHPIFTNTAVVRVGIEPKLVRNLGSLARILAAIPQLQSTAAEITTSVRAAPSPTAFVPVITLRQPVYEQIRDRIHDLDGTVFQTGTELLPPSAHYGEPLLGSVGAATADLIKNSKGRIVAGDQTGIGGLQQALDSTLAGTPATTVVTARADDSTVKTVAAVSRAKSGTPVTLTLDRATQAAAESALSGIRQAAAVVAVQRSTGRILADANSAAATYDLGLAGALPPGSTFKIATWLAVFTAHPALTPASTVACPATTVVDGRTFVNENKFGYPPIPIRAAFGYSCNTTAISEALGLPTDALGKAATALGLGARWSLPVASFSGSLPLPGGRTEQAADAIGQGRVQVSPLLMALMAGAATSGVPVRPSLVAGTAVTKGSPLPSALTAKMTSLMRATVALPKGTGHALADIPGVEGKTGTAEYGNDKPPRSHTWFAGVRGDLAFAVFVYDGASAGLSAVTIAHTFLDGLR